jgi:hypothetical protein
MICEILSLGRVKNKKAGTEKITDSVAKQLLIKKLIWTGGRELLFIKTMGA